jgi:RNA polymerase sigma-70 factor, ECF subfamily
MQHNGRDVKRTRDRKGYDEVLVQHSDQELIARCREGDVEAFGLIYERYERPVYRFAYHMLGDPDEADDIKQDTFVKAYRTLPGFRGDCSLLTWLLKVTGNLCRDRRKSQSRRGEMELLPEFEATLSDHSEYGSDPATLMERKYMRSAVHRVLGGLPAAQRELIVLRDIEGLSYQQIAEILGCSVASIKLRLFRARRGFKDRMESLLKAR